MTIFLFLSSWGPLVIWASLIFYLSSIPSLSSGLGIWDLILRKIAHIVEFAIFAGLFLRALIRSFPATGSRKIIILTIVFSLLYAISDEFHQKFVPGRGPSVIDVLIDLAGILLMAAGYQSRGLWTQHSKQ